MNMIRHAQKHWQAFSFQSNYSQLILFIFTSVTISGCATPPENLTLPENTLLVPLNLLSMQDKTGQTVRWGGTIVDVKNNKQDTQITILGYPLDSRARPNTYQNSLNRFIAVFPSFIDPSNYSEGREITVIGSIAELREKKIDNYTYNYPIVTVSSHQLWRLRLGFYDDGYYYYGSSYAEENINNDHYTDGHAYDGHLNDGHLGNSHYSDGHHNIGGTHE